MKLFLRYTTLLVLIACWVTASFPELIKKVRDSGIFPDDCEYGDLYRLSNLPAFKASVNGYECSSPYRSLPKNKQVQLFIIGDSFTEHIDSQDYQANKVRWIPWYDQSTTTLDSSQKNILILETVERYYWADFYRPICDNILVESPQKSGRSANISIRKIGHQVEKKLFPKNFNEKLEYLLFSYSIFNPIRELKATINLSWFGRVNNFVGLSNDRRHIYYWEETDSSQQFSSFAPFSVEKLNNSISNLNQVYDHYRKAGFDEVYLSIIPNKVTVLEPRLGTYNRLIEQVQNHPDRRMPYIDVYAPIISSNRSLYYVSDTHWNCEGREIWLKLVNENVVAPHN